jgi:hypothetical protein
MRDPAVIDVAEGLCERPLSHIDIDMDLRIRGGPTRRTSVVGALRSTPPQESHSPYPQPRFE